MGEQTSTGKTKPTLNSQKDNHKQIIKIAVASSSAARGETVTLALTELTVTWKGTIWKTEVAPHGS